MLDYFENLVSGIAHSIQSEPARASARKRYALEIARLGSRLYSGGGVAWCGIFVPFDVLNAMGVTSCYVEFVGAMLASTGGVDPMLEKAEELGFSTDGCSYHRSVLGATEQGLMPEPDFLIGTSAPCSGGLAVIEHLASHFKKDLFVIHVPGETDDDSVRFLAEQYRAMADFVAKHTGRPLDPAALRQAMELTNQTRELLLEVYELARAIPSPARRKDLVNFGIVMPLLFGTEAGLEVARAYGEEYRARVDAQTPGMEGVEYRLLWLQNRIQFKHPLDQLLDEEFHVQVVDELNDLRWEPIDPGDPWEGLARRALSVPLCGPVERRVERLKLLAGEYQVHGAINPCHWGCRQGTGARGLIQQGLKEAGIPVLNLEVDCVDPRSFAPGQLHTRIEAFIEMLQS